MAAAALPMTGALRLSLRASATAACSLRARATNQPRSSLLASPASAAGSDRAAAAAGPCVPDNATCCICSLSSFNLDMETIRSKIAALFHFLPLFEGLLSQVETGRGCTLDLNKKLDSNKNNTGVKSERKNADNISNLNLKPNSTDYRTKAESPRKSFKKRTHKLSSYCCYIRCPNFFTF
ncbi:hypothetical protein RIF29_13823 [Crotalaria pallida]|uniref:Uncharacterized protein n=1 Tax=Crotalaria pallida TaxID=3830 RepID=A0AAN9IC69_CROPI